MNPDAALNRSSVSEINDKMSRTLSPTWTYMHGYGTCGIRVVPPEVTIVEAVVVGYGCHGRN